MDFKNCWIGSDDELDKGRCNAAKKLYGDKDMEYDLIYLSFYGLHYYY